jgi:replicative DNA helicase
MTEIFTEYQVAEQLLPPHSVDAEKAVIGSALIDGDIFHECRVELPNGAEEFYIRRNGFIWSAFEKLIFSGQQIDYVLLSEQLKADGTFDEIGGSEYIISLINSTPTSTHAKYYSQIVHQNYIRRKVIAAGSDIVVIANNPEITTEQVTEQATHRLSEAAKLAEPKYAITLADSVRIVDEQIEELSKQKIFPGIPTPWADYNRLLGGGIQKSDIHLIAAPTGKGKTTSLIQLALHAAKYNVGADFYRNNVVIFSLEMPHDQLTKRMIAQIAGIDYQLLMTGKIPDEKYDSYIHAIAELESLGITIDGKPGASPAYIRSRCEILSGSKKLDMICVDSLNRMRSGLKFGGLHQEVNYNAEELKNIALEFNIPIWCAHQMNRNSEQRGNKTLGAEENRKPQLSDLREGGEQPVDGVMFIYHETNGGRIVSSSFIQSKHRNGPTGEVPILWLSNQTKFVDVRRKD